MVPGCWCSVNDLWVYCPSFTDGRRRLAKVLLGWPASPSNAAHRFEQFLPSASNALWLDPEGHLA